MHRFQVKKTFVCEIKETELMMAAEDERAEKHYNFTMCERNRN